MSLGVGLREAPVGVGSSTAVYSMVERAPQQLVHQRNEAPRESGRGFAVPASPRLRPSTQPSREAPPSRWAGPVIDHAADQDQGPAQRGQLIDILV